MPVLTSSHRRLPRLDRQLAPFHLGAEWNKGFTDAERFADISTARETLMLDLLYRNLYVGSIGSPEFREHPRNWRRYTAVGRVEVDRPIIFRLADDSPLITSSVTSISWLGSKLKLDDRDIEAMAIIGCGATLPAKNKHWWQRA